MKKLVLFCVILAGVITFANRTLPAHLSPIQLYEQWKTSHTQYAPHTEPAKKLIVDDDRPSHTITQQHATGSSQIDIAYARHQSDVEVEASGKIIKVLADDNQGTRHQKFILQVGSLSVLIAHNSEIAKRIPSLSVGDTVMFRGEYEWNSKGGVVHWTHHDPAGRHEDGWLVHNGVIYQ